MAKLITFTEVEDSEGKTADVTYHVPSSLDTSDMDQAAIADVAYSVTWKYGDGVTRKLISEKITDFMFDTRQDLS